MTANPIIEPACKFGSGISDSEIKVLMQAIPPTFLTNGFVCSNQDSADLDNQQLGGYFTALWAFLYSRIDSLHENQNFFDCIVDNFLCDWFSSRFAFVNARGTGTLTITAPALGGPWQGVLNYSGGGDSPPFTFGTSAASDLPVLFYDQSENVVGGNNIVSLAGGQSVAVPQTAAVVGSVSGILINTGCV